MKAQDEFLRALPLPGDEHVAAVTASITALMARIAATDLSYVHRAEICRRLQDVITGVSRGSRSVCLCCCYNRQVNGRLHYMACRSAELVKLVAQINPFTADPVKALHCAILV